jgi:micrococcal nuclease
MKIIVFCLIAIILVSSTYSASAQYTCQGTALCITGKVTQIVDGDTIYLKYYKIRLSLTDTPEKGEKGFKEATSFTKKLCPIGSTITVDQDDKQKKDVYGRVLGKVFCSGKVLNSELLYNGHANISVQYCAKSEFSKETWAQKYGCGTTTKELKQQIPKESKTPTANENQCDSSYPDVCIPPYPPDLDCGDIPYKNFRVLPPDPHRFDGDKDGIGCEK